MTKFLLKKTIPEAKQMQSFITALHQQCDGKPMWFQTYSKDKALTANSASFKSFLNTNLRDKLIEANRAGMNVSVAVNQIEGDTRSSKNVTRINAVFIDIDGVGVTSKELEALALPPNLVVSTSLGQRYHAYWYVSDCAVDRFKAVQKALATRFGTDPNVCDVTRVMRLPGSINWKYEPPYLAKVVHELQRKPVAVAKLIEKLELDVIDSAPLNVRPLSTDAQNKEGINGRQLSSCKVAKIQKALDSLQSDDRALWLQAGMAIHSVAATEQGYDLWTKWSMNSGKFDSTTQRNTWGKFKSSSDGINIQTLFWHAAQAGENTGFDTFKLSQLFILNYSQKLRYDNAMGYWYLFNGVVWTVDKQAPMRLAKLLIDGLSTGGDLKKSGLNAFRNPGGLTQIVNTSQLDQVKIGIKDADFDNNSHLLAVKNGVVDLVTGEFRKALPKDFLRRQCDVNFEADAQCPRWEKFINEVTKGDTELAEFLRRAVGYTLFGHTRAQKFFVLEGKGSNGKGVFLRVLTSLLGQYATELAPNLVTSAYSGNANSPTSALVRLKGIRLAIVTELPNKRGFDTAFVKQFSGGDSITARANYGEQFTFKPEGKLWISTNDMPDIAASDYAMWRRIMPIPFRASFTDGKRNEVLEETILQDERSGVLNWALAGAMEYATQEKLISCPAVEQHKDRLRRDSDVFGSWLKDHCVPNVKAKLQSSVAYTSYSTYAKRLGKTPMGMPVFGTRMSSMGYEKKETKNYNCFLGLELRTTI